MRSNSPRGPSWSRSSCSSQNVSWGKDPDGGRVRGVVSQNRAPDSTVTNTSPKLAGASLRACTRTINRVPHRRRSRGRMGLGSGVGGRARSGDGADLADSTTGSGSGGGVGGSGRGSRAGPERQVLGRGATELEFRRAHSPGGAGRRGAPARVGRPRSRRRRRARRPERHQPSRREGPRTTSRPPRPARRGGKRPAKMAGRRRGLRASATATWRATRRCATRRRCGQRLQSRRTPRNGCCSEEQIENTHARRAPMSRAGAPSTTAAANHCRSGLRTLSRVDDALVGRPPLASPVRNRFFAMGSSLRKKKRAKASGTTVKVGRVKKTKQTVTVKPVLLPGAKDETTWDQDRTHQLNYEHLGIVNDPNKIGKTGRNSSKLGGARGGRDGGGGGEATTRRGHVRRRAGHRRGRRGARAPGTGAVHGTRAAQETHDKAAQDRWSARGTSERRPGPADPPRDRGVRPPPPRARHPSSFPKNVAAHPRTLEPSNPRTLEPSNRLTHARVDLHVQAKHGENLIAMSRDRKLNAMQHTIAQLRELVVSYAWRIRISSRAAARSTSNAHENLAQGRNKDSMMSTDRDARIFSRRGRQPVSPCSTTLSHLTRLVAVVVLLYQRRRRFSRPRRSPSAAAAAPSAASTASAPSSISTASRVSASHVRL